MSDVVLVTGRDMANLDPEAPLVAAALGARGLDAQVLPWGGDTDWSSHRLVVVRSTWDYTDHWQPFLAWAQQVASATKLINPVSVLAWNSHKSYLVELGAVGVPVVPTVMLERHASSEEQRLALAGFDADVVVKPAVGAGARGAAWGPAASEPVRRQLEQLVAEGDVMVQPFVDSIRQDGEVSLLSFSGDFSHAVRKQPAVGDFRVQQHLGGVTTAYDATAAERAVTERALAAVPGPVTYARVDLVRLDGEPAVMEVELIEPYLFLEYSTGSVDRYVDAILEELP